MRACDSKKVEQNIFRQLLRNSEYASPRRVVRTMF